MGQIAKSTRKSDRHLFRRCQHCGERECEPFLCFHLNGNAGPKISATPNIRVPIISMYGM